jgi:hypothetical protein
MKEVEMSDFLRPEDIERWKRVVRAKELKLLKEKAARCENEYQSVVERFDRRFEDYLEGRTVIWGSLILGSLRENWALGVDGAKGFLDTSCPNHWITKKWIALWDKWIEGINLTELIISNHECERLTEFQKNQVYQACQNRANHMVNDLRSEFNKWRKEIALKDLHEPLLKNSAVRFQAGYLNEISVPFTNFVPLAFHVWAEVEFDVFVVKEGAPGVETRTRIYDAWLGLEPGNKPQEFLLKLEQFGATNSSMIGRAQSVMKWWKNR